MDNIENRLKKLEQEIEDLKHRRIKQEMILPDAVKQRHIGEGVRFIRSGLYANRPTSGESTASGSALYFATDNGKLSIWDSTQWLEVTLS
jgi:hypothetical protein